MKKKFATLAILFLFSSLLSLFFAEFSLAQTNMTTTTTTTKTTLPPELVSTLKGLYIFFASINPFVLLIFGIILFVVAHLSKYVAIVLIIFAVIQIILMLIR